MLSKPWVMGISRNYHNGAICLLHGEEVVVCVQEERINRIKRSALDFNNNFLSVEYCLKAAGIKIGDISLIADCSIGVFNGGIGGWSNSRLGQIAKNIPYIQISHHLGHAASVAYTSGFNEAIILVIDGGGSPGFALEEDQKKAVLDWGAHKWETLSLYHWNNGVLLPIEKHVDEMPYLSTISNKGMTKFASFGHMFSSVAQQIFNNYLEAGKVMGLAPYGIPEFSHDDFFSFNDGKFIFHDHIPDRFTHDIRWPENKNEYGILAASTQQALEMGLEIISEKILSLNLSKNLCYSGGAALNSVANHKVLKPQFDNLFILPAAEDSGTAIGAAFFGLYKLEKNIKRNRNGHQLSTDYLGCKYSKDDIESEVKELPALNVQKSANYYDDLVTLLCNGKIIGWFDGKSEFGPRALGHRSILCDPRLPNGKEILNSKIKHREIFRPFAPIIMKEYLSEYFEIDKASQLTDSMLEVCYFKKNLNVDLPAVMHVDGTGRVQTIDRQSNSRLYELLECFHSATGIPILVNTSFNIMGEPIVETPYDALWCLLYTGIDFIAFDHDLIIGKTEEYKGVMDLIPEKSSELKYDENNNAYFTINSPYGLLRYGNLPFSLINFYEKCDGQKTVQEIAPDPEAKMILGWLMRMKSITVKLSG